MMLAVRNVVFEDINLAISKKCDELHEQTQQGISSESVARWGVEVQPWFLLEHSACKTWKLIPMEEDKTCLKKV